MVHAHLDKGIAWTFSTLIVLDFTSGIYRAWQIESFGLATFVAVLALLFGWVAFNYLRKQRNTIELTDTSKLRPALRCRRTSRLGLWQANCVG
jgi:hypothetical protein